MKDCATKIKVVEDALEYAKFVSHVFGARDFPRALLRRNIETILPGSQLRGQNVL